MSAHFFKSATRSLPETLDLQMVCDAQACLRCLHAHQTPSAAQIQALNRLHATYDPVIRSFVIACGVPADDADDCGQEVWKDVYVKLPFFRSDGSEARFCSWLRTIAHSKATNFVRYRARHPCKHLGPRVEGTLPSRDGSSVDVYERASLQQAVQRVLALLRHQISPTSYRVFWMRSVEERTIEEVAAELHMTRLQVRCRLCRARQRFRLLWERLSRDGIFSEC